MNAEGLGAVAVLLAAFGVFVQVAWLFIGFRALRAHERIADALESGARRP